MRYQSFQLQIWRSDRFGFAQWSARLEEMQDGQSHRFTSPDALLSHLHALLTLEQGAVQKAEHLDNDTP